MKKLSKISTLGSTIAILASYSATDLAAAETSWPEKPVRIVVPFLAGGSIDAIARTLAQELSSEYQQSFIVENRAGAGGTIGTDLVAKSNADGYTFLLTAQGPFVINPFIMPELPYDAVNDFEPVSLVVNAPNVLIASPTLGVADLSALLERVESSGAPLTYATQGVGTTGHITGAVVEQELNIPVTHVAYKGFPPILPDVISGRVDLMIADTVNVGERARSGQLVPLAVASEGRSAVLPSVPTFAELGYPSIIAGPWFAMLAPAGTPEQVREELAATIHKVLALPAVTEHFQDMGLEIVGSTPEELGVYQAEEYERWGSVIREAGIQAAE